MTISDETPAPNIDTDCRVDATRDALAPVLDWYQSDEHEPRPTEDIVADAVADLVSDRDEVLRLAKEVKRLEGKLRHHGIDPMGEFICSCGIRRSKDTIPPF